MPVPAQNLHSSTPSPAHCLQQIVWLLFLDMFHLYQAVFIVAPKEFQGRGELSCRLPSARQTNFIMVLSSRRMRSAPQSGQSLKDGTFAGNMSVCPYAGAHCRTDSSPQRKVKGPESFGGARGRRCMLLTPKNNSPAGWIPRTAEHASILKALVFFYTLMGLSRMNTCGAASTSSP